jgi:hypothetical protein
MADNKTLETQLQVRQSAVLIQDEVRGIKNFEEEMKRKELKMRENTCNPAQEVMMRTENAGFML